MNDSTSNGKRVLRSKRRAIGVPVLGVVTALLPFRATDPAFSAFVAVLVMVVFCFAAWWPVVVVRTEGIMVRNLRTTRIPWARIERIRVEDQTPYRTGWAGFLGSITVRSITGLVVHLHGDAAVASSALQGTSGFWTLGKSDPAWLQHLAVELNDMVKNRPSE
jgi:hypothetical protein